MLAMLRGDSTMKRVLVLVLVAVASFALVVRKLQRVGSNGLYAVKNSPAPSYQLVAESMRLK
jgi:Ni/Fe-hydrogenase subunit HybB-like protein